MSKTVEGSYASARNPWVPVCAFEALQRSQDLLFG